MEINKRKARRKKKSLSLCLDIVYKEITKVKEDMAESQSRSDDFKEQCSTLVGDMRTSETQIGIDSFLH